MSAQSTPDVPAQGPPPPDADPERGLGDGHRHRSWWPRGFPVMASQAFHDIRKEERYQAASWKMNSPMSLSLAVANALHTVYVVALLFQWPGNESRPSILQRALVFAVTVPFTVLFLGLAVRAPANSRLRGVLWQVTLAVVSVMVACITSLRSLLCHHGAEPVDTCTSASRPNTVNLMVYSDLGLILVLIVARGNRGVMAAPFLVLLVLLTWNTVVVGPGSVPAWFSIVFYAGAFLFGVLVSTFAERNERFLFDANERLREEVGERRAAEERATRAERNASQFNGYVYHELRVPLNVVIQSEGLLESDDEFQKVASPDILENLARIHSGLSSIQVILNDVLDLKRFSEGRYAISLQPLDFHATARETLWSFEPAWKEKAIRFRVDTDPRIDALQNKLISDPIRLKQIVWNFTSNAIKFTPPNGNITFRTRALHAAPEDLRPGDRLEILTEVEDDGVGIAPEDQSRLFTDFSQIDPGRLQAGKGSGLGLAVCKNIIEALNGRYGVRSAPGRGSTFWFAVTCEVAHEARLSAPTASGEPSAGEDAQGGTGQRRLHVLVTDDDMLTRTVMGKLLVRLGHTADLATNGQDCLDKLAGARYDVLFIDNMMPVMTGLEAIRKIRHAGNGIPIISLSGGADDGTRGELLSLGVSEILLKPSNMQTIAGALSRATQQPH